MTHTCPECGATFEGRHDYCPLCNAGLWDFDDCDE